MRSKLLQTRNLFLIYLFTSTHTTRRSVYNSSDLLRCTFHKRTLLRLWWHRCRFNSHTLLYAS